MQKLIPMIMLLVLAVSSVAMAQTGTGRSSTRPAGPLPAPVGHRQPTADTVPADAYSDSKSKEDARQDAILDKKIKSICRGC